MLHGNPLLRGWWTSDVSFYTTELPEYALAVAAPGLSPDVVHICGALTYTLTVALAGLLARGRATGAAGLRRAGIAVAIMLAPSVLGGTEVFLDNPDHFGTSVPILLVLLLLDWGERRDDVAGPRWYVPAVVCALLAWSQVGDELSLVAATVPIGAVCAFRLAVTLIRRRPRAELRSGRRCWWRPPWSPSRSPGSPNGPCGPSAASTSGRFPAPGSPRSDRSQATRGSCLSRSCCCSGPTTPASRASRSRSPATSRSC